MIRLLTAAALVLLAGCLSVGGPLFTKLDDQPPTVLAVAPPMGGDAGVPQVLGGQIISVTFSEQLNVDSLRPGIVVRNRALEELPLTLQLESEPSPVSYVAGEDGGPRNLPMTVQILSAEGGYAPGPYQLILRTLLIDRAGNPLETEFVGEFVVHF